MSLTPIAPQHPLDAARSLLKKGIAVPYSLPLPTEDTNWKVSFEKPSDILVVGSWANKISVKGRDGKRFGVDLAVEMPEVSCIIVLLFSIHPIEWTYKLAIGSVPRKRLSKW